MVFDGTGEVREGLHVLGSAAVPVYLLDGPEPVFFDGGITCLGEAYVEAAREVLGHRQPSALYLTHVHFDHCGAVQRLKREFPGMKIAGSAKSRTIMERPNAVKLITELNKTAADAVYGIDPGRLSQEIFEPFAIDTVLGPGEEIHLGDGTYLRALASPGHTWDFLSYYVPERRILIGSEAVGVADNSGYVVAECLVDFEVYMTSLRRLASLEVTTLCQAHHYVYLDKDVPRFFRRSTMNAIEFQALVEALWEETGGDLPRTVEWVKRLEWDPLPLPKQPEPAYRINLEARIRSVLGLSRTAESAAGEE